MANETAKDEIFRAWFLIKVVDLTDDKKLELARKIFCGANSKDKVKRNAECSDIVNNEEDYAKNPKVIVVRADVVDKFYDLVVPVYVEHRNEFDKIEKRIRKLALEIKITAELTIHRLTVLDHVPSPPQVTWGYILDKEENSPKGPQGHSPW